MQVMALHLKGAAEVVSTFCLHEVITIIISELLQSNLFWEVTFINLLHSEWLKLHKSFVRSECNRFLGSQV